MANWNQDGVVKGLLLLVAVGLWALVLRPFVAPIPLQAAQPKYAMAVVTEKDEVSIGGAGSLVLRAGQVSMALRLAQREGWRLHSVVNWDPGRLLAIFEK